MNHEIIIRLSLSNPEKVLEVISPELKEEVSNRSKTSVKVKGKDLIIKAESKDVNALRAAVNNMLRLITVYEKSSSLK